MKLFALQDFLFRGDKQLFWYVLNQIGCWTPRISLIGIVFHSQLWLLVGFWRLRSNLLETVLAVIFLITMTVSHRENLLTMVNRYWYPWHMGRGLFVAASHQTGLDTRSKARRPIKVGIRGKGRSGTSQDSNPAGLCCSSAHLVQCEPDEASSFTNPNVGLGTYAGLWLELDTKV